MFTFNGTISVRPKGGDSANAIIGKERFVPLSIEVPDDIRNALETQWGDLSRHLRENLALDGYWQGVLSLGQVRRLLGFATRWDAQQFLGQRGVAVFDFDPSELDREAALQEAVLLNPMIVVSDSNNL